MKFIGERFERVSNMVKGYAYDEGFSEEELSNCTLAGFSKKTKSSRIMRMVRLAYYRGWIRGITTCDEMLNSKLRPMTLTLSPKFYATHLVVEYWDKQWYCKALGSTSNKLDNSSIDIEIKNSKYINSLEESVSHVLNTLKVMDIQLGSHLDFYYEDKDKENVNEVPEGALSEYKNVLMSLREKGIVKGF